MKPRLYLALFLIPLGLILAAVPADTTHPYKLSPQDLLEHVNSGMQSFSPNDCKQRSFSVAGGCTK